MLSRAYEGKTDLVEKWYGTNYSLIPIEESVLEKWRNVTLNDKLHLPDPNEFIPTKLGIKDLGENNPRIPRLIKVVISIWRHFGRFLIIFRLPMDLNTGTVDEKNC